MAIIGNRIYPIFRQTRISYFGCAKCPICPSMKMQHEDGYVLIHCSRTFFHIDVVGLANGRIGLGLRLMLHGLIQCCIQFTTNPLVLEPVGPSFLSNWTCVCECL